MSTVVDLLLRPALQLMPQVVDSTTQVVRNLEALNQEGDLTSIWLVTGDVTAFYTNIPPAQCASICGDLYRTIVASDAEISSHQVRIMIDLVMRNNLFEYGSEVYCQTSGLAMGTACAPLLANLYAGHLEQKYLIFDRRLDSSRLRMYNRYIDDILLVFQGTKEQLDVYLNQFSIGNLHIKWSCSQTEAVFLDLEILAEKTDRYNTALQWRVFRKHMNKHLYIPWSSGHPLVAKRAFVKGELVRLMLNSSKLSYFVGSRLEFFKNLRRRGYPSQTLLVWFRLVNWYERERRLYKVKSQDSPLPLMLPSEYNPVWECVNVQQLTRTLYSEWYKGDVPTALERPVIKSLAKSLSLFDSVSSWNLDILRTAP
jgi:hypothetical protein